MDDIFIVNSLLCYMSNSKESQTVSNKVTLIVFRRVRKTAKSECYIRYVCPSVRVEQLGSYWTYFHEIWYLNIFRRYFEKIQVPWWKSDKNNRYFTWRPIYIFHHISLSTS
jgi:hypothetical protein